MRKEKRDTEKNSVPLSNFHSTGESANENQSYEINQRKTQFIKVFKAWQKGVFTMKMVSVKTRIDRANICWIVDELRLSNRIYFVKTDKCEITGASAGYYTTNPEFKPFDYQYSMFEFE